MNECDRRTDGSYHIHTRDNGIVIARGHLPNADTGIAYLQALIHRIEVAEQLAQRENGQ